MILKLDSRFKKKLQGRFGKYDFQVGVLKDGPHFNAKRGKRGFGGKDVIAQYAGGPVRKIDKTKTSGVISDISKANRDRLGFNYLVRPFKKKNSDIIKFTNEFFKLAFGRSEKRRCENLLQAIVRNPILRGDYGSNTELTAKIKGFNRGMIDTAQLFKGIIAICKVRS